ncbi:MAG TPA: xanthine dehydrogenase family protein subunit M [Acidimicrobiaceae bacterium]|nr:xanthine dehydrogenase family protein subunit M [Acidimicrobiaceae bacterium]
MHSISSVKPAPFDYVAAQSVDHALTLLAGEVEAKLIAGGQSLMPLLNMRLGRTDLLIDIGHLEELNHIRIDEEGRLVIGASVTQADVQNHPDVLAGWPMLAAGIGEIGHPQIRNRGTICGSLAHNDPAAELPAIAMALDAVAEIHSVNGTRTVPVEDLFIGPFMTALAEDELLKQVVFPPQQEGAGWSFKEFATRPGDFATVGVAAQIALLGENVSDVKIVVFGVAGSALRLDATEASILGRPAERAIDIAVSELEMEIKPAEDIHSSHLFRKELAVELLKESIAEALERCL